MSDTVIENRFFSKVVWNGDEDECWEWQAAKTNGYGLFTVSGRHGRAHRWAYEHFVRPIPEGLTLDHLCRNRACVNPAHLEPVTRGENVLRGTSPSAVNARLTHCVRGHEFTPENTYTTPNRRGRYCRECQRAKWRRRWQKRKQAKRQPHPKSDQGEGTDRG